VIVTLGPDFDRRQAELDDLVARMDALADECLAKSERLIAPRPASAHLDS
jgi:hypothetical protein